MTWKTTCDPIARAPLEADWSEARETGKQLRRFLVVGSLGVATDFSVYYALVHGGVFGPSAAKAISYMAGVVVGFVLNKIWTFESSRRSWSEPATYLTLYAVTLGINVGCNRLALWWTGGDLKLLAFLFATSVTTVLNFIGMRAVTFRKGIATRRSAAKPQAEYDVDSNVEVVA